MNTIPVICPNCKIEVELGQAITVEGIVFLRVGNLLLREARGLCLQCGRTIYWSISDKLLEQVIKDASEILVASLR